MKKSVWGPAVVATVGALMLVGVAGAAFADTEDEVDVTVDIAPIVEPGALAMSVAPGGVTLEEHGTTPEWRQFTGELPTVTVTDTRTEGEVPDGAFWYVVGSSTEFVGDAGQPAISAGNLGWTPKLLAGGESGLVAEGDSVETVLDDGPDAVGLVDQEFLVSTADSEAVREEGSWSASADLFLRTPVAVAPGNYRAVITLSLFE